MPARPSSVGARYGEGDHQGVETPCPLVSAQKGAQEDKPPEHIKIRGSTVAGEKGARRRRTGGQVIET